MPGRQLATTLQFDPSQSEFEAFLEIQLGLVGCRIADFLTELESTYSRVEQQFKSIRNKYYNSDKGPVLRVAHNGQFTIFLYHLARFSFENEKRLTADKIYALLRMVSSVDLFYEVKLPELWACDHPLGAVIGRGEFESTATLFFSQNCNIGNNKGVYPRIAGNLHMYANSALLGDTCVSGNVVLSNGACVIDGGQLRDCIVYGRSPRLTFKQLPPVQFGKLSPLLMKFPL